MRGDKQAKSPHEHYVLLHGQGSVRSGKWKYYPWPEGGTGGGGKKKQKAAPKSSDPVQLYDLGADIGETKNIAADHPEVVQQLHAAYAALKQEIAANKRPVGKQE
jgi:arylsulfatase A